MVGRSGPALAGIALRRTRHSRSGFARNVHQYGRIVRRTSA